MLNITGYYNVKIQNFIKLKKNCKEGIIHQHLIHLLVENLINK